VIFVQKGAFVNHNSGEIILCEHSIGRLRGICVVWSDELTQACRELSSVLVSNKACEGNPSGLEANAELVQSLFAKHGCDVWTVENPDAAYRPVILAQLGSDSSRPTVGFFGHYDVEEADPGEWASNPWRLDERDGRWYGRGVADNIVPLAQRMLLIDQLSRHCNLFFILQGEEEIGSPFAMEIYADLKLPKVDVWVEETGYFYRNGNHRIMAMNVDERLQSAITALESLNAADGRASSLRIRPMNKAFGNQGCPCLVHLLGDTPYIALGPNDDHSTIHGVNESIQPSLLDISSRQLVKLCEVLGSG